jgi:hypothetical protein
MDTQSHHTAVILRNEALGRLTSDLILRFVEKFQLGRCIQSEQRDGTTAVFRTVITSSKDLGNCIDCTQYARLSLMRR